MLLCLKMIKSKGQIIMEGTWLYDGQAECKVQISKTDFKPGSGDFLDPEDVRNDQCGTYYNILYFSHNGELVSEVHGCESPKKAKDMVNKYCKGVSWS